MGFVTALRFLTIMPLPLRREVSATELGRSVTYFPLVGLVIGLVLAGLSWLLGLVLPLSLSNGLLVVALVVISGGLHLDGLADTCDGLASRGTVEERWQAMHDSRTGAFGIIGVASLLLLKFVALGSVPSGYLVPALVLFPTLSRWAMVYVLFAHDYARPEGLGRAFQQGATRLRFALATVLTLVIALAVAQLAGLLIFLGLWVIIMGAAVFLKGRFGGLTGDNYGAINEVAEVTTLILICLVAGFMRLSCFGG